MRVLFLTNIPSPYRVDFFEEIGKKCELTVLFERNNAKDREDCWFSNKNQNYKSVYLKGISIGNDSSLSFSVIKYLNKNFDIIVVGGYSTPTGLLSILYMKFKKIKFVLNTDGGIIKQDKNFVYQIKKFFISSASYWLSTGVETNKYLLNYGADEANIYNYPFTSVLQEDIIPKPYSIEEKQQFKSELKMKEENIILGIGQFIHRKGFDVLLKSSQYIGGSTGIYIIGGDAPKQYLDLARDIQNINIYLLDFKDKKELLKYYAATDIFVLPTREDIWGLVINEAMAQGLPIVTTNKCIAGIELIKNGENGFIVSVDNEYELSEKINTILMSKNLRNKMSISNIEKIKKYTIENMAQSHLDIFDDIIGGMHEK